MAIADDWSIDYSAKTITHSSGTKYLPYTAPGLITSSGFSLIVNQVVDGVLNG